MSMLEFKPLAPGRQGDGHRGPPRVPTALLALHWMGGLRCCLAWINRYAATPGPAGQPPAHWPSSTPVPLDARRPALVLFAHPQCPCTATTVAISLTDNGGGIAREDLTRIFNHGFTTRAEGHDFGLHRGALVARDMGGRLTAFGVGPRQGVVFALEIPLSPPR